MAIGQEWRDTQPRFAEMFDACGGLDTADEGVLYREFVAFFRGAIDGETVADPARAGVTVA